MHHKLREYADEVPELVEFNKEMNQWFPKKCLDGHPVREAEKSWVKKYEE